MIKFKAFYESLKSDNPCWNGYKPVGTKKKNGKTVPNCVPTNEQAEQIDEISRETIRSYIGKAGGEIHRNKVEAGRNRGTPQADIHRAIYKKRQKGYDKAVARYIDTFPAKKDMDESAAWQRKEGKSETGGLNRKGIMSYRRENPGSKLSMAVTTKPSKLKPGSKAAKRRKSFCARMSGVDGPMKKPNGEPTRKALALRKWNC